MKRIASILLALCSASILLTSCSGTESSKDYIAAHPNYADSATLAYAMQHEISPDSAVQAVRGGKH